MSGNCMNCCLVAVRDSQKSTPLNFEFRKVEGNEQCFRHRIRAGFIVEILGKIYTRLKF